MNPVSQSDTLTAANANRVARYLIVSCRPYYITRITVVVIARLAHTYTHRRTHDINIILTALVMLLFYYYFIYKYIYIYSRR